MKTIIALLFLLIPSVCLAGNPYYVNNYHNNNVVIRQREVQFNNADYFLGVNGYYVVGERIQERKQGEREALTDQNKQLMEIIKLLAEQKGVMPKPTEQNPQFVPDNQINPAVGRPVETPADPLSDKVLDIFKASCAKCHGDTKADAGLVLVKNGKLADVSLRSSVLVHHRVNGVNLNGEARMPKGAPALADDKVELIRQWLVQKAKGE